MYLKKKHIDFFSRTVEERSLWIQTFCRVLDTLAGVKPEISGASSTAYKNLLEDDRKNRSKSAAAINRIPQSHIVDGIESYSSASMQYNTLLVKGNIMKQIENVKWYHTSNFHQKHFTVNFTGSLLQIRDKESDSEFKFIELCKLRSCTPIEHEFESDLPGKRS